jgi:hypothetical protein
VSCQLCCFTLLRASEPRHAFGPRQLPSKPCRPLGTYSLPPASDAAKSKPYSWGTTTFFVCKGRVFAVRVSGVAVAAHEQHRLVIDGVSVAVDCIQDGLEDDVQRRCGMCEHHRLDPG